VQFYLVFERERETKEGVDGVRERRGQKRV